MFSNTLIYSFYKIDDDATITKEPQRVKGKKAGTVAWFAWIVLTSRTQHGKRIEGWINAAHLKKRVVNAPLASKTISSSVKTASSRDRPKDDPSLIGQTLYDVVLKVVHAFCIQSAALIFFSHTHRA